MSDRPTTPALPVAKDSPWEELRRLTPARIALGRTGTSLPTAAQLDFQLAHAQARDAVHLPFDHATVSAHLAQAGYETLLLHSAAEDRDTYLQRPDLGRRLNDDSAHELTRYASSHPGGVDLAVVIADGLSSLAVHNHAVPLLQRLQEDAAADGWTLSPIMLVEQGRVAIADEIGERLGAKMVVILIGERPGLSSPDSLGLYFTYAPKKGMNDANRNCISNIRQEGLSYAMATHRLLYLMREACRRQISGVSLKDEAQLKTLESGSASEAKTNFLLGGPPSAH